MVKKKAKKKQSAKGGVKRHRKVTPKPQPQHQIEHHDVNQPAEVEQAAEAKSGEATNS